MSKLKKVLFMCTAYVLVAALAIGGTVAYLTSTDSDINVMTVGNVKIKQHEYQRIQNADGTYKTEIIDGVNSYVLEAFEQGKDLLPIVGDPSKTGNDPAYAGWDSTVVRMSQVNSYGGMQVFAGKNAQDKFVTVENTGKTDAYVRTLVAVEIGSTDGSLIGCSSRAIDINEQNNGAAPWTSNSIGAIEIDGFKYMLVEYVYSGAKLSNGDWRHANGVLPAGDTTYPSIAQFYLKSEATNEDMVAIDGNKNGTLDILVLSQAVQAEGFANAKSALDTAFGAASDNAAQWFSKGSGSNSDIDFSDAPADAIKVEGADKASVLAAIETAQPGDVVALTKDTTIAGYNANMKLIIDKDITLDLNGHTITTECGWGGIDLKNGASIVNGTINHTGNTAAIKAFQVGKIENVIIKLSQTQGKIKGGIVVQEGAGCYVGSIKNVVIDGATNGIETYRCGARSDYAIGSMENVTINATDVGIQLSAPIGTLTNCTIKAGNIGINAYLYGPYSVSANLVNCSINATTGIYAHDEVGKTNPGTMNITYDSATALGCNNVQEFESEVADRVFVGVN